MAIKNNNNNVNGNKQNGKSRISNQSAKSLPPTQKRPPVPKVKPSKSSK